MSGPGRPRSRPTCVFNQDAIILASIEWDGVLARAAGGVELNIIQRVLRSIEGDVAPRLTPFPESLMLYSG